MADFHRLGYFLQIAELGSLTRTAERLGIAQPSLSRQMRLLEQELGVALFTRGYRGMQLTEAGEALRARIAGPLRQVGHALYEIRSLPSETEGKVVFGMPSSVVPLLGLRVLQRVTEQTPGIAVQIVEAPSGLLLTMMKRGEIDTAILYGPTPAGLNAARLLDDELVIVGAAGSFDAEVMDFRQVSELQLVLPSDAQGLRTAIDAIARKARTKLRVALHIDSLHLIKQCLGDGKLLTLLPLSCITAEIGANTLAFARIRKPGLSRQLYLSMQSEAEYPQAILKIEQFVRKAAAELIANGDWAGARMYGIGDS